LTIPAVIGGSDVIRIIGRFIEVSRYCMHGSSGQDISASIQALANEWPEYVCGPENPLGFLAPDMPCRFFGV
jgi:hypothetical protein